MNKENKAAYKKIVQENCERKSDQDYYIKEAFIVGRLTDGTYFKIEKPDLQKRFCFDDSYDQKDAQAQAAHARTSTDYFKDMNMRQLRGMLADFESLDDWHKAVRQPHYLSDDLTMVFVKHSRVQDFADDRLLSDKDIHIVIDAYKAAIQKQEKRIDTYLKKHGLEHVRAWTYWGDR